MSTALAVPNAVVERLVERQLVDRSLGAAIMLMMIEEQVAGFPTFRQREVEPLSTRHDLSGLPPERRKVLQDLYARDDERFRRETFEAVEAQVKRYVNLIGNFLEQIPDDVFQPVKLGDLTTKLGSFVPVPEGTARNPVVEPLLIRALREYQVPAPLRQEVRNGRHVHVIGGSGHGKSQLLQALIMQDVWDRTRPRTVVVIDSQTDLIDNVLQLGFHPKDELVLIDPRDSIEYPIALNLFDVGQSRFAGYSPVQREQHLNGVIELYEYIFSEVLDAEFTQKQRMTFRYGARLALATPDATIHTLHDIFAPGSFEKYARFVKKLDSVAEDFFVKEFNTKAYEETKEQVRRRIHGVLEVPALVRMFGSPKSKVDMFELMNSRKVILINTSKAILKESGSKVLGRFFLAMIAQAAQERAQLSPRDRVPTFVYIDEAQDYVDRNLAVMLEQLRKYSVTVTLAHQSLGQIPADVRHALLTNTAIKLAGGVSADDASTLAADMRTSSDFLLNQPKLTFAAYVKGVTPHAIPANVPAGLIERMPREDLTPVVEQNRALYSYTIEPAREPEGETESKPEPDIESFNKFS